MGFILLLAIICKIYGAIFDVLERVAADHAGLDEAGPSPDVP